MKTILIVDDKPIDQRVLSYRLQKSGHRVITAAHGREALERLVNTPCDLIISDLSMPEMDGITLLQQLRRDHRFMHLPFIVHSSSGHDQDRLRARLEGANEYLSKPTSSQELAETVNRLFC
jgi:CheY-like chemotaxis protein